MKIRTKIVSALALMFALLIALQIGIEERVLMASFVELERDDANASMMRVDNALSNALDSLESTAVDWGNWTDLYAFAGRPTPEFIQSNVTPVAMRQLRIDSLTVVGPDGRVILAYGRDLETGTPLDIGVKAGEALPAGFARRAGARVHAHAQGLLRTPLGIMMVAGAPILDRTGSGQSRGMLLVGRLLTPLRLRQLGAQAQVGLTMTPYRSASADDRLIETDTATQVFRPYFDLHGRPLMSLRVEVPRRITARGQAAVNLVSTLLIMSGVLALLLSVGVLARHFDRMVERVAKSRRQLVGPSGQAGFADLAKGVVHNLGNAMTPLGVGLARLGDRLRDAPVADVEFALAELAGEPRESPRHADLEQFLQMGCRRLAAILKEAQSDVVVVQRQAVVVRNALAELMGSTRNEHPVEAVRLPDLVSQSLEIVPDAAKQRLSVESDDSLRRVGVVPVARTVLRLVLQNLIINAADAVRDAGRERGVLRVAAEIVRRETRDELHLRCEDDGVGIAEENLQRVFERGYSTKPCDTNHGIGLHWCANAIASLGGRIWASSDGPGRGASLHLLLPLGRPSAVRSPT